MVKLFLKRYRKARVFSDRATTGGFTLLELLVAMVVGSLISAGLLFIVVQLIQTNLREAARSDTQRDLQAAIDYIARDVREAVYVYDAVCLLDRPTDDSSTTTVDESRRCPGLRDYLPSSITGTSGFGADNNIPVLAFWRVNPLPENLETACKDNATAYSSLDYLRNGELPVEIRGLPCLSGRMYTLVVYSLNNQGNRAVSRGRARIMRYSLPQFTNGSVSTNNQAPQRVSGWVDPRARTQDGKETSFLVWPVDKNALSAGTVTPLEVVSRDQIGGSNEALTDFVDWTGLYQTSGTTLSQADAPPLSGYELTPRNGTSTTRPPRGFYVYVRGAERNGDLNQEVVIRVQGDAAGRPGIPNIANRPVAPISLETRVLIRGVTNKTPNKTQ